MTKRLCALSASIALLSGCASFPGADERPSLDGASQQIIDGWNAIPSITEVPVSNNLNVMSPEALPDSIRKQPIKISSPGFITGQDLAFMIDANGIQAMISSESLEATQIYLPNYAGDLGGLTDLISEATNLSFRWTGGAIIIDQNKSYIVRISQNGDIAKSVADAIGNLGATDIFSSPDTGTVSYSASTKNQRKIADYLGRLSVNTSLIQVQLAVINVSLNDERNNGFDWSALSLQMGDLGMITDTVIPIGTAGTVTGLGAGLKFANSSINLTSALNMLSTFGNSRTEQNLTLTTLSGLEVSIDAGDEIPYISDINLQVDADSLNSVSGFETEVAETGFKATIAPHYENDDKMVTMFVDLDLKSLKGFRELSAGANGTVTHPEIQKQLINSIVKLKAGQTVLLGGLIVENFSDNRQSLSMLDWLPFGSQSMKNNQNAIFVLIRPTVTVFGGQNDG